MMQIQEESTASLQNSSSSLAQAGNPKKKLTEAEKEKLTIIKRKLLEKR